MRGIPKARVAAVVHARGLLPPLIKCAASDTTPAQPAAQAFIDVILDPAKTVIDLDDAQYQDGADALVAYEVVTQEDIDAVDELYVPPEQFEHTSTGLYNGMWLAVFTGARGTKRAVQVPTEDADVTEILATMNSGG